MDIRPELNNNISVKDFEEFYWLKEELVQFCRKEGIPTSGGKIELSDRIKMYLSTGIIPTKKIVKRVKPTSKFDWNKEKLSLSTVITDNYKNSENVRAFFREEIGSQFSFNVKFMNWMKNHNGHTLKDAIEKWKELHKASKQNTKPKEIAPQFEYNRYLRDFLADNPNEKRETGIKLWKIKRSLRGDNTYNKKDLDLLDKV